jgi:phenylalanyl-tRNA synthetase alpha chain
MTRLPEIEYKLLSALEPAAASGVEDLVGKTGLDQSKVMAAARTLAEKGLVEIDELVREEFAITEEGIRVSRDGLPEKCALQAIVDRGGAVSFQELPALLGKDDVRAEVKWLTRKGWCSRDAGQVTVTDKGRAALRDAGPDEVFVCRLAQMEKAFPEDLSSVGTDVEAGLAALKGRSELFKRKQRTARSIKLTDAGDRLKKDGVQPAQEVTQLTPELIASGEWRCAVFKKYDPQLESSVLQPGKIHPLQRVIQETRRAFLEMGFEEVDSPAVDTAFWVFDALFQPQDHPAREMQDTFYVAIPEQGLLPADELVERIGRTHEDGGDTGSTGWRYKWSRDKARKLVLRTHTTAATIRALARNPKPPRKVFSIGRTFRRENVDQTHLAEFIQIDGIIVDEKADLASLFGTLAEFYRKMGAEDVRFRPSFFPYTEPSAEVFAKLGNLGWVEMCGSGVFRPEVTRPLGCDVPVLAWGGGVERIAMMRFGLDDIRKLYLSDIDWLKGAPLCR